MALDLVQDLTFETDSLALFEPMLAAAMAALQCEHVFRCNADPIWQYPSHAAAYLLSFLGRPAGALARWRPPSDRPAPHYLPICRLSRRADSHRIEAALETTNALETALELVRAADVAAFEAESGDGPFYGCDGTVGAGYRLHGARGELLVSLCHIYYPK
jgi:hypothetical protein